MKTIGRILIILAAATIITGLALAVVNITGVQASQVTGQGQFHDNGRFEQGGIRPDNGRSEGGSFSMAETIKNLAIVAVMTIVVVAFERLLRMLRKNRLVRQPVSREQLGRKG
jgi:amino acid transporter